jgi:hypothetical protein
MTGMMTLLVSMSLYLILLFGDPFSGDMRVSNSSLLLAQMITSPVVNKASCSCIFT